MGLIIDFSYETCLGCGSTKKGSNFLKDKEQFIEYIFHILNKMIPEISKHDLPKLKSNSNYHTHPLDQEKTDIAIDILREIVQNNYKYNKEEAERWLDNQGIYLQKLWQISCPDSKGIRMIGFVSEISSVFKVLFIDYHHQIYKDEKHNDKNASGYDFSVTDYVRGGK